MNPYNEQLQILPRISSVEQAKKFLCNVLLFPTEGEFDFDNNNMIHIRNLGFYRIRDLIRAITIQDALNISFTETNILVPLAYAESLEDIPWHLNTQGLMFTTLTEDLFSWINKVVKSEIYKLHEFDSFWLPFSKPLKEINIGDRICIFNRRVGGWDGSYEHPVIELLGAGGHVPVVYDSTIKNIRTLGLKENFQKEVFEELGITLSYNDIHLLGGYKNENSHELVVLSGINLPSDIVPKIQDYAVKNLDEDTMGIYLGTFNETMSYYKTNPIPFAGGIKSAATNFPNQRELMKRILEF
jgi:hypothetical protein